MLTRGIAVLSELSPSLEAVLVKVNYLPTKEDTILSTSLSTPALEDKEMNKISAGTLVAVATVCLRFLRDDVKKTSQVLIATLQMLLAQAKLVCDVGDLSGEELQAFKRELGGEFVSFCDYIHVSLPCCRNKRERKRGEKKRMSF